jgi:hypothetical protein
MRAGLRPYLLLAYKATTCRFLLLLLAACGLRAEIVSEAMLSFPSKTEAVEYDNLYELRRLPNYSSLRQRFAGKQLDDAKAALSKLGVNELLVNEIVMGTSPTSFYGLVAGTFSAAQATKAAQKNSIWPYLANKEKVFCPKGTSCVVFLDDSLAAFGPLPQIKAILDTRLGITPRLGSNAVVSTLMNNTEIRFPVRGVVYGSQLNSVIGDALQQESGLHIDWTQFTSNISAFSYSVSMDSRAHVIAKLQCKTPTMAGVLRQMLGALGGVQSVTTRAGKDPASMPFQNLEVSASGNVVDLKMDTPLP